MTNPKFKSNYVIGIGVIILLFFQNCNKLGNIPVENNQNDLLISEFSKIGEIHNASMDYVYQKLVIRINKYPPSSTSFITLRDLNGIITEYIKDSLNATGFNNYTVFYSKDTIIKNSNFSNNSLALHYNLVTGKILSNQLQTALLKLEELFKNDSINKIFSKYDSLITAVTPKLSSEVDKKAFICATSIAKNSTKYWIKNLEKWNGLKKYKSRAPGDPDPTTTKVKDIVYADVAGGLVGLVSGAITGGSGGTVVVPLVGTVVGAAAGGIVGGVVGGVGASAAEGIHTLIKWAIDW